MNVLVTGAGGQLGTALQACVPAGIQCLAVTRNDLDITNASAIARRLDDSNVTAVINAAAYTDVERAEREPDQAIRINATACSELANACKAQGARLIHVSTDFVFDGKQSRPYLTTDEPNPLSVYGRSKLQGEHAVLQILAEQACVVRTSWLHSAQGANFVTKILTRMRSGEPVRVVTDEVGSPTAAYSLAEAAWACVSRSVSGVHHWSDSGAINRFEFADAIAHDAYQMGLLRALPALHRARVADFKSAAARPAYSVLDTRQTEAALGMKAIPWREGLKLTLEQLQRKGF